MSGGPGSSRLVTGDPSDSRSAELGGGHFQVGGMPWGRRLAHDMVVYGLGGSAAKVINAFLLPVFVRIMAPGQFGAIDLMTSIASIIMVVGGLGLESALIYFYARSDDPAEHRRIASTALWTAAAGTAVVSLVALVGKPVLEATVGSSEYSLAYVLTLVYVPINLSAGIVLDVLRLEFRSRQDAAISFFATIGTAAFAIAIVALTGAGAAGYMASQIAVTALSMVAGGWLVRRSLGARPSVAVLRRLLMYGLPLAGLGITAWVLAWSDRLFLTGYGYVGDLGYYAAANRIAQLTFLPVLALQTAWSPFAIAASRDPAHRQAFVVVFKAVSFGLLAVVALTSIVAGPVVAFILPAAYGASLLPVPLLAGAIAALGLSGVVAIGLVLTERTGRLAVIGGVTAASNILLNIVLIPPLGITGAAAATLVASIVSLILVYLAAERVYPIGYPGRRLIVASGSAGLGIGLLLSASSIDSGIAGGAFGLLPRTVCFLLLTAFAAEVLGLRPYALRAASVIASRAWRRRAR